MKSRENILEIQPKAYKAMMQFERLLKESPVPEKLLELIKIRASQINKCGACLEMHTKLARRLGETEERLYLLNAWKYAGIYNNEEKVALALTEELTLVSDAGLSDHTYQNCLDLFGKSATADLIIAVVTINAWNRIMIASEG